MSNLLEHCCGEKMNFSRNEKRTINSFTCLLINLSTNQFASVCQFFSKKFNIMSACFIHQSRTLPQKNDSREGLF